MSFHPDNRAYSSIGGFYDEPEGSLQGVYIGSSNCYAFWNPLVAWKNYGIAVYSYASSSLPFYATEYLIREVRKTQPEALIIVNLNAVEADDMSAMHIHNLLNYMPWSENKLELMDYLAGLIGYSKTEQAEFAFPWIGFRRYPFTMLKYILKNGITPISDGLKGTSSYTNYLEGSRDITEAYIHTDGRAGIPEALVSSVESLLDYCDETQARVLFVSVPRAENGERELCRINTVSDMVRVRGYEVLEWTDAVDAMGIDLTQDYYDQLHTNIHGSVKFTNYLSEYLISHYELKNMSGSAVYAGWDEAWTEYAETVFSTLLPFELDGKCRDYLLEAPENMTVHDLSTGTGGRALSWSAVTGADGYAIYRKNSDHSAWTCIAQVEDAVSYFDGGVDDNVECYYTVVPFRMRGGEICYGNFNYKGIRAELGTTPEMRGEGV